MKKAKKHILRLCLFIFAIIATVIFAFVTMGYNMYLTAVNEKSITEAVNEIRSKENYTELSELPEIYIDAVIAVEDHRFYQHGTVDYFALARAMATNIKKGKLTEGGSTITQQLAKNMYFTQSKRIDRKIAEYFAARELEKNYSKDEILELYLNDIYFGSGYYCVYDASVGYFDKIPTDLTPYEATLLAGIPNAPSVYSLNANPDLAKQRQSQVIEKMLKYNKIDNETANEILGQ